MTTPEGAALAKAFGFDGPTPDGIMLLDGPGVRDTLDRMAAPTFTTTQASEPLPPRRVVHRPGAIPTCWWWEFDPTTPHGTEHEQAHRLWLWQDGRCAVCGRHDAATEDHDHESGLTRGYLCRSCNLGEAVSGLRVFALYRWRHPTSILGLHLPYTGRGWCRGRRV